MALDFIQHVEWLQRISSNELGISINQESEVLYYKQTKITEQYKLMKEKIEYPYGCIGRIYKNRVFKIVYKHNEYDRDSSCYSSTDWYNEENRVV